MKTLLYEKLILGITLSLLVISCEDFLEVDIPDNVIVSEVVFQNDETAVSAITGIYNELSQSSYSRGWENSVSLLGGISADALRYLYTGDPTITEFNQNEILPDNYRNLYLWSSAYTMIYMTNALLEGIERSDQLSEDVYTTLEGEAKFVRAFTYFYLLNLYGEVPLILTTDYRHNSLASQTDKNSIYQQIILDLTDATNLLGDEYRDGDRSNVNRYAALGLLARVNLYLENWAEAERLAGLVLSNTSDYELKDDLNESFLANSKEALWQISPSGNRTTYTFDGTIYISHPTFTPGVSKFGLTNQFLESFENTDKRLRDWIGFHENSNSHFPHKYKHRSSQESIIEYSMVLRLAEQYFIRAEARARLGDLPGALTDLDKIRMRAGLNLFSEGTQQFDENQVLDLIMEERKKELFTEWAHRWLDLKRIGQATTVLGTENLLFPIPEAERLKNPNLNLNN